MQIHIQSSISCMVCRCVVINEYYNQLTTLGEFIADTLAPFIVRVVNALYEVPFSFANLHIYTNKYSQSGCYQ